jgi:hypothetical protein
METIFDHNVSELTASNKQSLEAVLGRPLQGHQRVFIRVFDEAVVPDEATRRAAMQDLEQLLDKADQHAREHGITAEEADAAVEEAMQHVRRGQRA